MYLHCEVFLFMPNYQITSIPYIHIYAVLCHNTFGHFGGNIVHMNALDLNTLFKITFY